MKTPRPLFIQVAVFAAALLLAIAPWRVSAQELDAQTGSQKSVIVIADDSESMAGHSFLPGYGLQVLATVLDEERGDKLAVFGLNQGLSCAGGPAAPWVDLSETTWDTRPPNNSGSGRPTRECLGSAFNGEGGTPYNNAIPPALELARDQALAGIDTHLVVFSDGEFTSDFPERQQGGDFFFDSEAVRRTYEEIQSRLRRQSDGGVKTGRIIVDYVTILHDPSFYESIVEQGVRYNLLNTFNGSAEPESCRPEQGCWEVPIDRSNPDGSASGRVMWETLRAIIAKIGNTDVTANDGFVSFDGRSVVIESPLTISRIVAVSARGSEPALTFVSASGTNSGDLLGSILYEDGLPTRMEGLDESLGDLQMVGQTVQFAFPDGLPPQRSELTFSDATCPNGDPCDVFLLFDILSKTTLRFEDASGNPPSDDADDFQLLAGQDYRVIAQLENPDGSIVDLNHKGMTPASFTINLGGEEFDMQIDRAESQAIHTFTAGEDASDLTAIAIPTLPGFGTPASDAIGYDVVDASANLYFGRFNPDARCTDCREGEHRMLIDDMTDQNVGSFTVGNRARIGGGVVFDLSRMNPAFALVDGQGETIEDGQERVMTAGEEMQLLLRIVRPFPSTSVLANPVENIVSVSPSMGWRGGAVEKRLQTRLDAPDLTLGDLIREEDCSGCAPDLLLSTLQSGPDDVPVGHFDVRDAAEIGGALRLTLSGGNNAFYLVDDTGNPIGSDEFRPGDRASTRIGIMRRGVLPERIPSDAPIPIQVLAERTLGWAPGTATIDFSVRIQAPDLEIWVRSHDSDPSGEGPLEISGSSLWNGESTALVALKNVLDPPSASEMQSAFDMRVDSFWALFHSYAVTTADSVPGHADAFGVNVSPSARYWCLCFMGLHDFAIPSQRDRQLDIEFLDPKNGGVQSGATSMTLRYQISAITTASSCLLNLVYLVVLYLIIRGIRNGLATRRFPRYSEVEMHSPDTGELYDDMRRTNWTWLRCWFKPSGPPHERINVQGMEFEATGYGPALVVKKPHPAWRLESQGNKLLEHCIIDGEQRFQLYWGDKLTDTTRKKTWIRFHEDHTLRHD